MSERREGGTARHERKRFLWGVPGTALTLSVVGAPLGLPMLWKAFRHQRALDGADRDLGEQVRSVISLTLGLTPRDRPLAADGSGRER